MEKSNNLVKQIRELIIEIWEQQRQYNEKFNYLQSANKDTSQNVNTLINPYLTNNNNQELETILNKKKQFQLQLQNLEPQLLQALTEDPKFLSQLTINQSNEIKTAFEIKLNTEMGKYFLNFKHNPSMILKKEEKNSTPQIFRL